MSILLISLKINFSSVSGLLWHTDLTNPLSVKPGTSFTYFKLYSFFLSMNHLFYFTTTGSVSTHYLTVNIQYNMC